MLAASELSTTADFGWTMSSSIFALTSAYERPSGHSLVLCEVWEQCSFVWKAVRRSLEGDFNLRVEEDDNLCIVSCSTETDLWRSGTPKQRLALEQSRGTIFEKRTGRCICLPFLKFWNASEKIQQTIDWTTAVASEKIDGCFLKLFFYDGSWRLASNRTLAVHKVGGNKYACTGRSNWALFNEAAQSSGGLDYGRLNPEHVYMLERVHPDFTVVIPAKAPRLYHLGTRDMRTLEELNDVDIGLPRPQQWDCTRTLSMCQKLLDQLPGQREGLVIRDAGFRRMKLKRKDYVLLHLCVNGSSPDYSWVARAAMNAALAMSVDRLCLNAWLRNEGAEFVAYFPEHRPRYQVVASALASIVASSGWLPAGADPRERSGAFFKHEARLAWIVGLLVV